jgi:hypothetical protein
MKTVLIYFFSLFIIASAAQAQQVKEDMSLLDLNNKASIAGKTGGEITKDELLKSKGVETSDSAHHISGYKLTIATTDAEPLEFPSGHSGKLTELMRDAIKKAPAGSKISFEYIYCSDKHNMPHIVNPLIFVLK